MQEKDFKWFLENKEKLFEQYGNTVLVIKDRKVISTYSTYAEAVKKTLKTEEAGSFIVQECSGTPEAYTNLIMSVGLNVI